MLAFVDGAVDINRRLDQGGATFGGAGVVLVQQDADSLTSYRVIGVPFWPNSLLITNNTMEVMAAKIACDLWKPEKSGEILHVWTDSAYVKNMLSFGTGYSAQKNKELIEYARRFSSREDVMYHHVRGHNGLPWNEMADLSARKAVTLKKGFDKTYACNISLLCFRCRRFPCTGDKTFGTKNVALATPNGYAGISECDRYQMADVEGVGSWV